MVYTPPEKDPGNGRGNGSGNNGPGTGNSGSPIYPQIPQGTTQSFTDESNVSYNTSAGYDPRTWYIFFNGATVADSTTANGWNVTYDYATSLITVSVPSNAALGAYSVQANTFLGGAPTAAGSVWIGQGNFIVVLAGTSAPVGLLQPFYPDLTGFDCRITSSDGAFRRTFHQRLLGEITWSIERYGGYGAFTIETFFSFDQFSSLPFFQGDRVEFWYKGSRHYRGYVGAITSNGNEPKNITLSGYGRSFNVKQLPIDKLYVFAAGGSDVGNVFSKIATENVLPEKGLAGYGAVGVPILTGNTVTSVVISNPGNGYLPGATSVSFIPDPTDTSAAAGKGTASINPDGTIASVTVVDGGVFSLTPSVVFSTNLPLISQVTADVIGVPVNALDARLTNMDAALNEILRLTSNIGCWGVDVNDYAQDRMYLRNFSPFSPPTHALFMPGPQIDRYAGDEIISDIRNVYQIIGGNPRFPNLIRNGNMEAPLFNGQTGTNFVKNNDFETGSTDLHSSAESWNLNNGASLKTEFHNPPSVGVPFSGKKFLECDNPGENATQTVTGTFAAGHLYTFSVQAALEVVTKLCIGHYYIRAYDSTNALLATFGTTFAPTDQAYQNYSVNFTAPSGISHFVVDIGMDSYTGYSGQGGIVFDDVQFYDANSVGQDNWTLNARGTSSIVSSNWISEDGPADGAYCAYFDVNVPSPNTDNQDVGLIPNLSSRVSVTAGYSYRFGFFYRSPSLYTDSGTLPGVQLQMVWLNGDGTFNHFDKYDLSSIAGHRVGIWSHGVMTAVCPNGASAASFNIVFRTSGAILVDCIYAMDSGAPDITSPANYYPDGPIKYTIRSDDSYLLNTFRPSIGKSVNPSYKNSINAYGIQVHKVTESSATTKNDCYALADNFFEGNALPIKRPTVTVVNMDRVFWPGDTISFQGADGPEVCNEVLPIVRIKGVYNSGIMKESLECQKELPDSTIIIAKIILDYFNKYGVLSGPAGTGGGGGGYSNPIGSGAGGGPTYRTTLQASATDPTLHDDFRSGPHVADLERTSWNNIVAEVETARTSEVLSTTYSSLDSRLDSLDSYVSAIDGRVDLPLWSIEWNDTSSTVAPNPETLVPTYESLINQSTGNLNLGTNLAFKQINNGPISARISTYLLCESSTGSSISVQITVDDACSIYLNGSLIGSVAVGDTQPVILVLNLVQGWNKLSIGYANNSDYGSQAYLSLHGTSADLSALVDGMRAALPSSGSAAAAAGLPQVAEITGNADGTDYNLTSAYAAVTPAGGAPLEIILSAGQYLILVTLAVVAGSSSSDDLRARLYNQTASAVAAGSEQRIGSLASGAEGQIDLCTYVSLSGTSTFVVQAANMTAARGVVKMVRSRIDTLRVSASSTTYPLPIITDISPTSGATGTSVTITGKHFSGATSVKFNGASSTFTVVSDTSITTTVPSDATTGPVTVTTAAGTATSATNFTFATSGTIVYESSVSGGNSPVGSITVSTTGTNRVLLLWLVNSAGTQSPSSPNVTWSNAGVSRRAGYGQLWVGVAASVLSSELISFGTNCEALLDVFRGVNMTTPIDAFKSASVTGSNPSCTLITSAANTLVVGCISDALNSTLSAGGGFTAGSPQIHYPYGVDMLSEYDNAITVASGSSVVVSFTSDGVSADILAASLIAA